MTFLSLIWKAVLVLLSLGCLYLVIYILSVLCVVCWKALKKEVQNDGSKNMP